MTQYIDIVKIPHNDINNDIIRVRYIDIVKA
jgi:hypothetical protein